MHELTIQDIFDLAAATTDPAPEERLKTLFTWKRDRLIEIGKLCIGTAASLLVATIIAIWKGDTADVSPHWPWLVISTSFAVAACGLASFLAANALGAQYVVAVRRLDWARVIVRGQAQRATPAGGGGA